MNAMVFYPRYGLILSNIPWNWIAKPSSPFGHWKILQINSSEYWTVLIHTSDKRPSHSHCYQVNDCQVTYIKAHSKRNIQNSKKKTRQINKRWTVFLYWKKIRSTFCKQNYFFILKGRQCLNKCASPLITKISLLQSFT